MKSYLNNSEAKVNRRPGFYQNKWLLIHPILDDFDEDLTASLSNRLRKQHLGQVLTANDIVNKRKRLIRRDTVWII